MKLIISSLKIKKNGCIDGRKDDDVLFKVRQAFP